MLQSAVISAIRKNIILTEGLTTYMPSLALFIQLLWALSVHIYKYPPMLGIKIPKEIMF